MNSVARCVQFAAGLALLFASGCGYKFIMPPKPHVGALPPAALAESGQTNVGLSYDNFASIYYNYDLPTQTMLGNSGRIEARHIFATEQDVGDIGGYVSGYAFGFDGGYWFRPDKRSEKHGRWAFRLAPNLSFGNFLGVDQPTRNLLPSVGASGDGQWAKRLKGGRATVSFTAGGGFALPLGIEHLDGDDRIYWPMLCFELQNRWDFGPKDARVGGFAAAGLQLTWVVPSGVVSGGVRF